MINFNHKYSLTASFLGLIGLVILIGFDSRQHFGSELVQLKKKHHSAQRNWNIFFGQENVYLNGALDQINEIEGLEFLSTERVAILSDLATSYYLASSLPIYVKNVHKHHGRYKSPRWDKLIESRSVCYINHVKHFDKFKAVLKEEASALSVKASPVVEYLVLNNHANLNLRRDCFSKRTKILGSTLSRLAEKVYEGETLTVFRLSGLAVD